MKTDLVPLLPDTVVARFPRVDDGNPFAGLFYAVPVTLASLALPEFAGVQTSGASHVLKDFRQAVYTAGVLQNGADLAALARQLATDWYRFRASPLDTAFAGSVPYAPEALSDRVTWDFSTGTVRTRVQRPPYQLPDVQLLPSGGTGAGPDADYYQIMQNNGVSQTQRTKLNIIPGAHVTYTFADDAINDATKLTIATDNAYSSETITVNNSTVTYTTDVFNITNNSTVTINNNSTVTFDTIVFNVTNTTVTFTNSTITFNNTTVTFNTNTTVTFNGVLVVGGCMLWGDQKYTAVTATLTKLTPAACTPVIYIDTTAVLGLTIRSMAKDALQAVWLVNLGPNPVVLRHEDTAGGVTANERFNLPNNADLTLNAGEGVGLHHDDAIAGDRWHCLDDEKAGGSSGVTATNGQTTLGSDYTLTGTYIGVTGMSVNLPVAGTYLLSYSATARLTNSSPPATGTDAAILKLFDSTAAADVPGTEQQACELTKTNTLTPDGLQNATGNAAATVIYTVTGTVTIKLYAKLLNGAAGVSGVVYGTAGSGVAEISFVRLA